MSVTCSVCGSANIEDLGPLPAPPPTFGGQPLPIAPPAPGHFWRCRDCCLRFRAPYLTQAELTELYEKLPDSVWLTSTDRPPWPRIRQLCEQYAPGRTILDVGCFNGDFLMRMPVSWNKLGVEPGCAARKIAAERGIALVGHSIDDADMPNHQRPDVITLLDVVEHFRDPLSLLRKVAGSLCRGGCIIILSGNAEAIVYRLLSNNYWYCAAIPEHVAVLSPSWLKWAAPRLALHLRVCETLSAETFNLHAWLRDGTRNFMFAFVQRLRCAGINTQGLRHIPILGRAVNWPHCPTWLTQRIT